MKLLNVKLGLAITALMTISLASQAEVLYQASTTGSTTISYEPAVAGSVEVGDEIHLKDGAVSYAVKSMSFDYKAEIPSGQTRTAVVKLYQVDGTDQTLGGSIFRAPRTLLYTSSVIQLQSGANGFTASFNGFPPAGLNVAKHLVWTVTFSGGFTQTPGNRVGLLSLPAGSEPQVGRSFADYWYNNNGTWETRVAPGSASNLLVTINS